MSEMELVLNNTSQKLLSLAKTLNPEFEGKVLDSLLVKRNTSKTLKKKKINSNFLSHPERLSSESELSVASSVKNGFSDNVASFHYNKFFNNNITPSDSTVSTNAFLRGIRPIIRSPVLSSYSDTETTLINKEEVTAKCTEIVRAATLLKSKQKKFNQNDGLSKRRIDGVHSKPCFNKVKKQFATTTILMKPKIITTPYKVARPIDLDKKLRNLIRKALNSLEEIRIAMLDDISPPDGIEEFERMKKRTMEFVSLFGRNHVYSLERHIAELEKLTKCSDKIALRSIINIHQTLLVAHQRVMDALQNYRKNMLTCIPNLVIEKLICVLNKCCSLCKIHKKCMHLENIESIEREELLDDFERACKSLLMNIQHMMKNAIAKSQFKPKLKSHTRFSLRGYRGARRDNRKIKPKKISSRLSMYSAPSGVKPREVAWSKHIEHLNKEQYKYGYVQSRYLTAGYKHRPPTINANLDKPPFISVALKTKCFNKKITGCWRGTPLATVRNEDEIQTIVETQKEKVDNADLDSMGDEISKSNLKIKTSSCAKSSVNGLKEAICYDIEKSEKEKKLHELSPLIYELCEQVITAENEAVSQKHLEGLLKGLLGMALNEKIDGRESGSKKNGFLDRNNCHNKYVQGQNSQSPRLNLEKNGKFKARPKDLNANKIIVENSIKCTRSDESLDVRKRKKLNKIGKMVLSASTVTEKSDIKNVEENQPSNGLLEYVQSSGDKCKKVNLDENLNKKKIADANQANKNKRRQTITVTGAKNAQLICIKNEDSIGETGVKGTSIKCDRNNNLTLARTKGTMDAGGKAVRGNSKLSRVPKKELRQLKLIPRLEAMKVIQYKIDYFEYVKGKAMYKRSASKQPWVIVNSLSESLLNNVLLSIAKEIQIDDILTTLYKSEFQ